MSMVHRPARNVPAMARALSLTSTAKSRAFRSRHLPRFLPCAMVISVLAYLTIAHQDGAFQPRCGTHNVGVCMVGLVVCISWRAPWCTPPRPDRWLHHHAFPHRQVHGSKLYRSAFPVLTRLPAHMRAEDGRDRHPHSISAPFLGPTTCGEVCGTIGFGTWQLQRLRSFMPKSTANNLRVEELAAQKGLNHMEPEGLSHA